MLRRCLISLETSRHTRKNNPNFGELSGPGIDLYRPAVLLDDDVVTNGQAKPRALASGLSREERVEQFVFHLGRNARAVVADPDLHAVPEVLGRGSKGRLVVAAIRCLFALGRCIEAVIAIENVRPFEEVQARASSTRAPAATLRPSGPVTP
jgi:hypothetical protein